MKYLAFIALVSAKKLAIKSKEDGDFIDIAMPEDIAPHGKEKPDEDFDYDEESNE